MNSLKKKNKNNTSQNDSMQINKTEKEVDEDSHNMALAAIGHSCLFVQSISASTYPVGGVGPTIFTMIRKILHFYINTSATRHSCHAIICSENSFYFSSQILRIMRTKFGFNRNNQTHFLSFYVDS